MQLEEAKRNIKNRLDDIKEYIEYGMPYSDYLELQTSFETVLKYIDNSIPIQVVEDEIKKHKEIKEALGIEYKTKTYEDEGKKARDFYMLVAEDLIINNLEKLQKSQVTIK